MDKCSAGPHTTSCIACAQVVSTAIPSTLEGPSALGPRGGCGSLDTRSRANGVDALHSRFVERLASHGPLAAFGGQYDLDPVRSGNALAQSAAATKAAFDNFLER